MACAHDVALQQPTRRRLLQASLAGVTLSFVHARPSQATPEALAAALKETFGDAAIQPGKIKMDIAVLAEDGNVVPVTLSVDSPMTEQDHVKTLYIFSEKNPLPRIVEIHLSPANGRARVSTRIRLATSQNVLAIAKLSDGTLWSTRAPVEVTIQACGD